MSNLTFVPRDPHDVDLAKKFTRACLKVGLLREIRPRRFVKPSMARRLKSQVARGEDRQGRSAEGGQRGRVAEEPWTDRRVVRSRARRRWRRRSRRPWRRAGAWTTSSPSSSDGKPAPPATERSGPRLGGCQAEVLCSPRLPTSWGGRW